MLGQHCPLGLSSTWGPLLNTIQPNLGFLQLLWGPFISVKVGGRIASTKSCCQVKISIEKHCNSCLSSSFFEHLSAINFRLNKIPKSSHIIPICGNGWVNLFYPLILNQAHSTHPCALCPHNIHWHQQTTCLFNFNLFGDFITVWVCSFFQYLLYLYYICRLYKHSGLFWLNFYELLILIFIMITVKLGNFLF